MRVPAPRWGWRSLPTTRRVGAHCRRATVSGLGRRISTLRAISRPSRVSVVTVAEAFRLDRRGRQRGSGEVAPPGISGGANPSRPLEQRRARRYGRQAPSIRSLLVSALPRPRRARIAAHAPQWVTPASPRIAGTAAVGTGELRMGHGRRRRSRGGTATVADAPSAEARPRGFGEAPTLDGPGLARSGLRPADHVSPRSTSRVFG
jgi:hypothetical protein